MAKPLPTGIYGIIGAPGSGKSFKAVREIVNSACTQTRPIFTNVPIRPKRLRALIYRRLPMKVKGHAARRARANLVRPISHAHFERFCKRLGLIDETAERIMSEWGMEKGAVGDLAEFQQTEARNAAMQEVTEKQGEPIISGTGANWIPPGSVLFLDELHKWYPSKGYKDEPKAILDFTSMHRHMQLKVFVMSQRWMNVSLSFRSMATEVWYCMNWAKKPIVGFIRLQRLGNIFRYTHYLGEDVEEKTGLPRPGAERVWAEFVCPELGPAYEYDCYRSYSHAGTLEEQEAEIQSVTDAMLGVKTKPATPTEKEDDDMPRKDHWGKKLNRWVTFGGVCSICIFIGRCTAPPTEVIVERQVEAAEQEGEADPATPGETVLVAQADPTQQQAATPQVPERPAWADKRISGITATGAMIDGNTYNLGDTYEDLFLVACDGTTGLSIWLDKQANCFHWRAGGTPRLGVLPAKVLESLNRGLAGVQPDQPPADPATP